MLIKSLRVKDFRQFRGESTLEFSVDPDRNVTVVLGDNSYGKSTLLQAFNWCLYNKTNFKKDNQTLLNFDVGCEMRNSDEVTVEVELKFEYANYEFDVLRQLKYFCINNKVIPGSKSQVKLGRKLLKIEEEKDDQSVKEGKKDNLKLGEKEFITKDFQVSEIINSILPEDLSSFFFFDAERVDAIGTKNELKNSVEELLDVSSLKKAIDHIGVKSKESSVLGLIESQLDRKSTQIGETALKKVQTDQKERESVKIQLENVSKNLKIYNSKISELETFLLDNKDTATLQKMRNERVNDLKKKEKYRERTVNEFFKQYKKSIWFFIRPLLSSADIYLNQVTVEDKGVPGITEQLIKALLQRGECLCGQKFTEGEEAYNHLTEELKALSEKSIVSDVDSFKNRLDVLLNNEDDIYSSINLLYESIIDCDDDIVDLQNEIKELDKGIKKTINVEEKSEQLENLRTQVSTLERKKEALIRKDEQLINSIRINQSTYDKTIDKSDKNKLLLEALDYANRLKNFFNNAYKDRESKTRNKLQETVNFLLGQMYHGQRSVYIDSQYNVELRAKVLDRRFNTGESEGLNRVKNFAFIAGLVTLAKNRLGGLDPSKDSEIDGLELSEEPYPLVMDAPFSNTDHEIIKRISKVLPQVAEQVIMFVMEKDWNFAQSEMEGKIGKSYRLKKESETITWIHQD